jgi:hypothetical protein
LDFAARKRNVFSSPVKQQTMHNIGVAWDCKMKRKLIVSVTAKKTTTSQHNGVLWNMVCTITKKRKTIKQSKANCLVKICYIIHVYMHAWFQTLVLSAIRVSIILKQIKFTRKNLGWTITLRYIDTADKIGCLCVTCAKTKSILM